MTKAEILAKIEEYKNNPAYVGLGYQLSEIIGRYDDNTHNKVVYTSEVQKIRTNLRVLNPEVKALHEVLAGMLKL